MGVELPQTGPQRYCSCLRSQLCTLQRASGSGQITGTAKHMCCDTLHIFAECPTLLHTSNNEKLPSAILDTTFNNVVIRRLSVMASPLNAIYERIVKYSNLLSRFPEKSKVVYEVEDEHGRVYAGRKGEVRALHAPIASGE